MKKVAVAALLLMSTTTIVSAQDAAPSVCPNLPATSGLHWQEMAQKDFILCKAITEDGREVMSMTLTSRDPDFPLNRSLREEKGSFAGESLNWFRPDLGGQQPVGYADRRITVVKLDKNSYAQIALYPADATERQSLQGITGNMNTTPTALAGNR